MRVTFRWWYRLLDLCVTGDRGIGNSAILSGYNCVVNCNLHTTFVLSIVWVFFVLVGLSFLTAEFDTPNGESV